MLLLTDYLARIECTLLMGTLIGVERQYRQRNAGLRTNILVSVGAAAFTVLSHSMTSGNGDPSRVAAQIVSRIVFLGGGLILKDGVTVRGLNTAATIWYSATRSTLSGVGLYKESAILVACVLVTHCLFRPLCTFLEKRTAGVFHYSVRTECQRDMSDNIQQLIMDTLAFDQDVWKHWESTKSCSISIASTFPARCIQHRMGETGISTGGVLSSVIIIRYGEAPLQM